MKCLCEVLEKVCKFASVCYIVECEFVSELGDYGHIISIIFQFHFTYRYLLSYLVVSR